MQGKRLRSLLILNLCVFLLFSVMDVSLADGDGHLHRTGERWGGMGNGDTGIGRPMMAIEDVMAKLKNENPEEYARLIKLRQENRGAFLREIRNRLPMPEMMSPEARRLEGECLELSRQYRQARTAPEREAIKKELTVAVEKATDVLIRDMKARLKQMEQQLKEKEKDRDTIIRKRLEVLLDRTKKLPAWEDGKPNLPPRGDREDGVMRDGGRPRDGVGDRDAPPPEGFRDRDAGKPAAKDRPAK